jgi:hypothetical protein
VGYLPECVSTSREPGTTTGRKRRSKAAEIAWSVDPETIFLFVRAGPILPMSPLTRYTDELEQGQASLILCAGDEFRLDGVGITSGYQRAG